MCEAPVPRASALPCPDDAFTHERTDETVETVETPCLPGCSWPMAVLVTATVLEKIYGTDFAAAHIYGAGWFSRALGCPSPSRRWPACSAGNCGGGPPSCCCTSLSRSSSRGFRHGSSAGRGALHLRTGDPGATAFAGRDGSEQILPFRARLDDFRIEYCAGTRAPMDFVSLLTLTADDGSCTVKSA